MLARGLAQDALQQITVSQHLPSKPPTEWHFLSAQALMQLGSLQAAEAAYRDVLAASPEHHRARGSLVHLLRRLERRKEALALIEAAPIAEDPLAAVTLCVPRLGLLMELWRVEEARRAHNDAVQQAATVTVLGRLFPIAARIHGDCYKEAFDRILARLATFANDGSGEYRMLEARLRLGLGDGIGFLSAVSILPDAGATSALAPHVRAASSALRNSETCHSEQEKVFVVGLSRTATSSLHEALLQLGFAGAHWTNPLTGRMLTAEDAMLFDALSDIPAADAVETLADRFPTARFILSERPLESWLRSIEQHYRLHHATPDLEALRQRLQTQDAVPFGSAWRRMHENLYTRHPDFTTAYAAHETRVMRCFRKAPERLLRFNVFAGDGWQELCGFLRRPVPAGAFPHANAG